MRPRVAVCDYGVSNVRSVERALAATGAEVALTSDPAVLRASDGVVLPGVGAFIAAAAELHGRGLAAAVLEVAASGRPVLGVCLGHQLLFASSDEGMAASGAAGAACRQGLGLLPGEVRRLQPSPGVKVPHMGWNRLRVRRRSELLAGIPDGSHVYFVHSYSACVGDDFVDATTEHGETVVAAVSRGNIFGVQFHPEKSGEVGLSVYSAFVGLCARPVSVAHP